jgi:3-oxoacyl-[acyl-carrier-protein] synthase II
MKFAITGIGILNGLGDTLEENWENLLAGKSTIQDITWPEDNPDVLPSTCKGIQIKTGFPSPTPEFTRDEYDNEHRHWTRSTKMTMYTANQAYKDSGLTSKNVGVFFTTTVGQMEANNKIMKAIDKGREKYSPKQILNGSNAYGSEQVQKYLKLQGPSGSIHTACATGIYLLDYGIKTLMTDPDLDAVMIGCSDSSIQPFVFYYFQNLNALSRLSAADACKPFDLNRSGFVLGEGSCAYMLEPLEKAVARGAHIYGLVLGTGISGSGVFDTEPDPTGHTQRLAVHKALRNACVDPEDIDYINAHATGTPVGDEQEYDLMNDMFHGKVMVSNKGQIGHTLGVCSVIELVYTIMALKEQRTPPNVNLTTPVGQGMQLPTVETKIYAKYAIKNSFAFGGRSACAVLAKYDGETE